MGTMFIRMDQGTTLAWTQSYGTASRRERTREWLRDAAFALAVMVFVTGVAGFVAHEDDAPLFEAVADTRPAR